MEERIIIQDSEPKLGAVELATDIKVPNEYKAPTVISSAKARQQVAKDLAELSRLTGVKYTL